jgi:glycosyltransferase involved in cell wall biosynthesis
LYNAFSWRDRDTIDGRRADRGESRVASLHWYSQTLGPGRGLDELLSALALLDHPAELHLRGKVSPGYLAHVRDRVPAAWRDRVFIHDLVPNDQLLSRIAEHDIGLALEARDPPSRDLTVTNKILHYLLAGLPVVASNTAGQSEVAEHAPGAVRLYESGSADSLAGALDELLSSPAARASAREAALDASRRHFCWEVQAPILLQSVHAAMRT